MNKEIHVWDLLVRIFHWSLVLTFFISYLSDDDSIVHIYSGYAVLGLIVFRLIWGFIGSNNARFSIFISTPSKVIEYLKSLISGKPQHYKGHNPAAGWMVIALLISLFVTTISGLKTYAVEEGKGPLANVTTEIYVINSALADDDDKDRDKNREKQGDEFWEEIHEVSANFTLFLIFLHVLGVFVSSKLHKENLVKAMITGKKKVE